VITFENAVNGNPDRILALSPKEAQTLMRRVKELIDSLADVVKAESPEFAAWPHLQPRANGDYRRVADFLEAYVRRVISRLGIILADFELVKVDRSLTAWERRNGQIRYNYGLSDSFQTIPSSIEYRNLDDDLQKIQYDLEQRRTALKVAKANEFLESV